MHAIALIATLALAGAPGSSVRPGSAMLRPHVLLSSGRDTAAASRNLSSFAASFNGSVESLSWEQTTAGVDGVGGGNNVFRVAILLDEDAVCFLDVACDAPAGASTTSCSATRFATGQKLVVRITSMPCLGAPAGFQTTDLEQW